MVKLYRTDNMEGALRSLAQANRNVLVLCQFRAIRPIRIRFNLVADIPMKLVLDWRPGAEIAVEKWTEEGGILQFRPNPLARFPDVPGCDAMLIPECVFQHDTFMHIIHNVRQEVVVYRPPTWELHNETINAIYPAADDYQTFDLISRSFAGRDLSDAEQHLVDLSGYKRYALFTGKELMELTGWSDRFIKSLLRSRYRLRHKRWHIYRTTFPVKSKDEALRNGWDVLRMQPEIEPNHYAMAFDAPAGSYVYGFKKQMRRLLRFSYVLRLETTYVVDLASPLMDRDTISAINNVKIGRWFKMRNLVDSLPEYDIQFVPPAPSLSEGRSDDTDC